MDYVKFGQVKVSRFIIGSNPFSGFSHQSNDMDLAMKKYYTTKTMTSGPSARADEQASIPSPPGPTIM